jgi:hypothetical protein
MRRLGRGAPLEGGAEFSACGHYRWWLWRRWDPGLPRLVFVGLNPSRADGRREDPTLRRLLAYARRWGFGQLEVLNLFARVAAQPAALRRLEDPVGEENNRWITRAVALPAGASVLWLGWGNGGAWRGRDQWLMQWLQQQQCSSYALSRTAKGQPRHPLYCSSRLILQPYGTGANPASDPASD